MLILLNIQKRRELLTRIQKSASTYVCWGASFYFIFDDFGDKLGDISIVSEEKLENCREFTRYRLFFMKKTEYDIDLILILKLF